MAALPTELAKCLPGQKQLCGGRDLPEMVATHGYPSEGARLDRWTQLSGAFSLRKRSQPYKYWMNQIVSPKDAQQIDKDVHRALPHDLGPMREQALRRVLRAHACRRRDLGYTQGLNIVTGTLLLVGPHSAANEESVFWLLCALTDKLLDDYFGSSLSGVRADVLVIETCLNEHPELGDLVPLLEEIGVELSVTSTPWLVLAFANALPLEHTLRVWDLLFTIGSRALLATALAILSLRAAALRQCSVFEEVWELLGTAADSGDVAPLECEELMAAVRRELRHVPQAKVDEMRIDARRKLAAPKELAASDALRDAAAADPKAHEGAAKAALAAVGLDPTARARWLEATYLRTALGLGSGLDSGAPVGALHSPDPAATRLVGEYVRGVDLSSKDLDDEARAALQRLRFRLRAVATPVGGNR